MKFLRITKVVRICVRIYACVCVCVCYSQFSTDQTRWFCLMFQLWSKSRYAQTLFTVQPLGDFAGTSLGCSYAHAHVHTHAHTHSATHILRSWQLKPWRINVCSWFQKIYCFHMFLIHSVTSKSTETTFMCVCALVCVVFTSVISGEFFPLGVFPCLLHTTVHSTLTSSGTGSETAVSVIAEWFHIGITCGSACWTLCCSVFLSCRCVEEVHWSQEQSSVQPLTPRSSWVASTTGNLSRRVRTELKHTWWFRV